MPDYPKGGSCEFGADRPSEKSEDGRREGRFGVKQRVPGVGSSFWAPRNNAVRATVRPAVLDEVAEAPWSGARWAVARRFDNPRASLLVLLLGDTPLQTL